GRLSSETDCWREVADCPAAFGDRSANERTGSGAAKTVHFSDPGKQSDFTAASGRQRNPQSQISDSKPAQTLWRRSTSETGTGCGRRSRSQNVRNRAETYSGKHERLGCERRYHEFAE